MPQRNGNLKPTGAEIILLVNSAVDSVDTTWDILHQGFPRGEEERGRVRAPASILSVGFKNVFSPASWRKNGLDSL